MEIIKDSPSKRYIDWINCVNDEDLLNELKSMEVCEINEAFACDLEFGTGGQRGVLGAGTNRLNVYTVAKTTQGIANYLVKKYDFPSVAISYDSRHKSEVFAKKVASIFAGNGIKAYIYPELMPTPCLSFATRFLKCLAGVMITASHNPAQYNGYKVYGEDGCQITTEATKEISLEINRIDIFKDIKEVDYENGVKSGLIKIIENDVYDAFINNVNAQSVLYGDSINKHIKIVYTPLNGTGLKPVLRALKANGYDDVIVVKEQEKPDGNFPTCKSPNPENKEALVLGIEYAKNNNAELVLATDPDCDRVGIAVKQGDEFLLLSGNETGTLLFDFICSQRIKHNTMPKHPYVVKTIVTTELIESVAKKYNVSVKNVLTGFKYIGEQIGLDSDNYIFGLEESYGYLSGTYVRDKDAVNASLLIVEMYAFYKAQGKTLIDRLKEIYDTYGYYKNSLYTFVFEGQAGKKQMASIMDKIRGGIETVAGYQVTKVLDYSKGENGLPLSNVIQMRLATDICLTIRPSGTEPKLKMYISVVDSNQKKAEEKEGSIVSYMKEFLYNNEQGEAK